MAPRFSKKNYPSVGSSAALIISAITLASIPCYLMRSSKAPIALAVTIADAATTAHPFTLGTVHYSFQNNPKGESSNGEITARRCDGTTVMVQTMRRGKPLQHTFRAIRYLDGRRVQLNDAIAAKTTWPAPPTKDANPIRERLLHPPPNCLIANWEIFLRNDTVLGHKVDVVSESFTTTAWKAPELGCETLQYRIGYKHDGVFKLEAETRAISLKLGEPDPRLFDEGAGYAELSPSEMLRRKTASEGVPLDHRLQEQAASDDKLYFAGR